MNARKYRTVRFPRYPVTKISRPPTQFENDLMMDLEDQISYCRLCRRTFCSRLFRRLCSRGQRFARRVIARMYDAGDGHVYSSMYSDQFFRVEVPHSFLEVRRLLEDRQPKVAATSMRTEGVEKLNPQAARDGGKGGTMEYTLTVRRKVVHYAC